MAEVMQFRFQGWFLSQVLPLPPAYSFLDQRLWGNPLAVLCTAQGRETTCLDPRPSGQQPVRSRSLLTATGLGLEADRPPAEPSEVATALAVSSDAGGPERLHLF